MLLYFVIAQPYHHAPPPPPLPPNKVRDFLMRVKSRRFPPIEEDMRMVLAHCGSLILDTAALQQVPGGMGDEGNGRATCRDKGRRCRQTAELKLHGVTGSAARAGPAAPHQLS